MYMKKSFKCYLTALRDFRIWKLSDVTRLIILLSFANVDTIVYIFSHKQIMRKAQ